MLRSAKTWWPTAGAPFVVSAIRRHGSGWVAKLDGVDDPEQAERLRGIRLAVARDDFPALPEGEYYWVDLIGARVINRQGECLGEVGGLRTNGVHDVLEVVSATSAASTAGPTELLVPMVADFVDGIDLAASVVRVDWQRDWS